MVKWNTIGLLNLFSLPCFQFAAERPLGKHFSVSGEVGIGVMNFIKNSYDTPFVQNAGYKANVELRYYRLKLRKKYTHLYTGLNFGYRYEAFNTTIPYIVKTDSMTILHDGIGIVKHFVGCSGIVGLEMRRKRFLLDLTFGVGAMQKYISNTARVYDTSLHEVKRYGPDEGFTVLQLQNNLSEASGLKFNGIVAFRLGYIIYKSKSKKSSR